MTLQEAKDQVANKHAWAHFQEIIDDKEFEKAIQVIEEASELYASFKWNEACELQRKICGGQILWGQQLKDIEHNVYNASKPKFKP